jgi:hypothetical protein
MSNNENWTDPNQWNGEGNRLMEKWMLVQSDFGAMN